MDIIAKGGFVLLSIISCSVAALTIIIECLQFYRKLEQEEQAVMIKLKQSLVHMDSSQVTLTPKYDDNALVQICKEALDNWKQGNKADVTLRV